MNNSEHPDKQGTVAFSDQAIRRCLLGRSSAAEQTVFEERLFIDEEFEARVRLAELDLTDDYAFARLTTSDRELFEQNFPVSGDRKRALEVSTALRDRFASALPLDWRPPIVERVRLWFRFNRLAWRYAFATIILAVLIATVWLVTKEPQIVQRFLPGRAPTKSRTSSMPKEAAHSTGGLPQTHQENSPEKPIHGESDFSIVLRANETPTIVLSANDREAVRMHLMRETNDEGTYRAELLTSDGQSVVGVAGLRPADGAAIDFDIPARLIKAGEYQIKLSRLDETSTRLVGVYYFRVR